MIHRINIKKLRFFLIASTLVFLSYYISGKYDEYSIEDVYSLFKYALLLALISIASSLLVQLSEGGKRRVNTIFYLGVTPYLVVLGCFLFYSYYPNLSLSLKIITSGFYILLLYTLLLLNNVVLIVGSREVNIPIYRAALNWVQIILLCDSILIFTCFSRLPVHPGVQSLLVVIVSIILYGYLLWVYSEEVEIKTVQKKESVLLIIDLSFLVGWAYFSVLFISAESFLRGLFVASVFLLGLGYTQLYIKNSLSKRNIRDYMLICGVFFMLLILFRP